MIASFTPESAEFFTLKNGLRVMICPQSVSTATYVSMAVKAGHFYDPAHCQGLSHLLEHMMFLGSRHLPKANAINDLIDSAGGTINAWTGTEYANYHFHCDTQEIKRILPLFADMMRTPLLYHEAMDREIHAIDAEFQFKRKDDLRRLYQIHKETANQAHPFSQFSVGSAEIFRGMPPSELHAALHRFHEQYYVANNMCLAIFTHKPDAVKALVAQSFASLKPGEPASASWPPLYTRNQLGVEINIVPLQAARRMIVTFALPGLHNDVQTKPLNYFSHLLGDEGEGSLLAYLKGKNWVTNLIAGSGIEGDSFKDFNVSFQLTEEGLKHKYELLEALFAYLSLMQVALNEKWRYREKAHLSALAYQYEDTPKLQIAVCDYAQHLFLYSADNIKQLRSTIDNYDKIILEEAFSYFTPHNMRVKVIAQGLATDRVCAHYDAEYRMRKIDADVLTRLSTPPVIPSLQLPPPNPYLGEEYHVIPAEDDFITPVRLLHEPHISFWFAQDSQFHSPKGDIFISFDCAAFTEDLTSVAAKRLWLSALNDHLQAKYYRAEIAGLHYRLYGHQAGFTLHTRGFSNNQTTLALQLLETVHHFQVDTQQFARIKASQVQSLKNTLMNKPTNRLFSRLSVIVQRNTQAPVELLKAVEDCTFEQMQTYQKHALTAYYVDSFMHGNWSAEEARVFAQTLKKQCSGATGAPLSRAVSQLPVGQALYHFVACDHDDAAVVLYLQAPSAGMEDTAMCMVLEQMIAAPFFNVLRTEKQLGYVVGTGYVPHNQHPGMAFYIQSPSHGPEVLLREITEFLFEQLDEIDFYRFYWSTIQKNLLKQLEERDLSLSMKSQRLWLALGSKNNDINWNEKLADKISRISFDEIQAYASAIAKRNAFGELVLFSPGKFDAINVTENRHLTDLSHFKRSTRYFNS